MEARIDELPELFRTVFMLRAVEEMPVEEVAAALDIPEATVRTRFFRARGLLRESLSRDMDFALEDAFSFDGARCDRIVAQRAGQHPCDGPVPPCLKPPGESCPSCHAHPCCRAPPVPRAIRPGAVRRRGGAAGRQRCARRQGTGGAATTSRS